MPNEKIDRRHENKGRPLGTVKWGEAKTEKLNLLLTPTAKAWVKSKPPGWLADTLEEMAREGQKSKASK